MFHPNMTFLQNFLTLHIIKQQMAQLRRLISKKKKAQQQMTTQWQSWWQQWHLHSKKWTEHMYIDTDQTRHKQVQEEMLQLTWKLISLDWQWHHFATICHIIGRYWHTQCIWRNSAVNLSRNRQSTLHYPILLNKPLIDRVTTTCGGLYRMAE